MRVLSSMSDFRVSEMATHFFLEVSEAYAYTILPYLSIVNWFWPVYQSVYLISDRNSNTHQGSVQARGWSKGSVGRVLTASYKSYTSSDRFL